MLLYDTEQQITDFRLKQADGVKLIGALDSAHFVTKTVLEMS